MPHPLLEVADDLVGHLDGAEDQVDALVRRRPQRVHDHDVGELAGGRRVVGLLGVQQRDAVLEVEGVDDPALALVQVHRARVRLGVRGAAVHGAEQPAGTGLDEPYRRPARAAQVDLRPVAGGPEPAARPRAQHAAAHEVGQHEAHLVRLAEELEVGLRQRQLGGRAAEVRPEDVRVARVQHGRLHRPPEQRLGVVHEVGVQRVVARDQDGERLLPGPAGAPGLLPHRGDGAGPAGEHDGVEAADVQAELEGVGGGDAEQLAALQPLLERAALLRQVARAVGRDPVDELGRRLGQRPAGGQRDRLGAAAGAHEGQRPGALDDQVGQQLGGLGVRRAAHRCAVLAVAPPSESRAAAAAPTARRTCARAARRRRHRHDRGADQPGRRHLRVADGRAGEHEDRVGAVPRADAAQPPQHQGDVRAEDAAVPVALVDHDVPQPAQERRPVARAAAGSRGAACRGW